MTIRDSITRTMACTAALLLGLAASLPAQDTTQTRDTTRATRDTARATAQQRIPVQKRESFGDVLPRDTARTDTTVRDTSMMMLRDTTVRDTTMRDTTVRDTTLLQTQRDTTLFRTDTTARDTTLIQRDTSLLRRDTTGVQRDTALFQRDPSLIRRDTTAIPRDTTAMQRDTTLMQRDTTLVPRDTTLMRDTAAVRQDTLFQRDTVMQDTLARRDTSVFQRDTAAIHTDTTMTDTLAARADTAVAQIDTMTAGGEVIEQRGTRYLFGGSGWYIGVAAGPSPTTGDLNDLGYESGFTVNVPIGWHKPTSALGFRLDLGYNQFNGDDFSGTVGGVPTTISNPDPKVWSAVLNATLGFPLNETGSTRFYLVGGGGLYLFRDFGQQSALGSFLGNDVLDTEDDNETSLTKFGLNGGAGLEFGIGALGLFLESRFVNVFADRGDDLVFDEFFGDRSDHVRWIPIMIGVNIR